MNAPKRIQRHRTKGWRKPPGAIIVDRTSRWGNPFKTPGDGDRETVIHNYVEHYLPHKPSLLSRLDELAGHDLACACPLDQPCHADVLLDLVNRP